ncbi:MAG: Stp1/IreP family PP2C-type Ser/Thr phosphatase [Blastocatellia bacterium]
MSDVQVSVFARTDVGMHRSGNEDSFLVADLTTGDVGLGSGVSTHPLGDRGSLMIVSDGMGGAAAGEIASEMAVTTIRESLEEMTGSVEIAERLKAAAEMANERIWNHSQSNVELAGMGATLTAVLVQGTTAFIAQVGDSRAYLIRGDRIKQLTKDQSLAQMLVDSGAIKPDQMDSVPQNVIMQALGTQPVIKVAMTAVELYRDDCLLICSDGLSNKVSPDELRQTVQEVQDLTEACSSLIEKANERGGEDNITVIIARFDGEALHSASESNSITGSFRALNQGYFSDYFSGSGLASQPDEALPSVPQLETTAVMQAIDVSKLEADTSPAASSEGVNEVSSGSTTERPELEADLPATARPRPRKQGYALILVIALISLLLLGVAGFFVYSIYVKPQPPPADSSAPE